MSMGKAELMHRFEGDQYCESWGKKRAHQAYIDEQVDAFLKSGRKIENVTPRTIVDVKLTFNNQADQEKRISGSLKNANQSRKFAVENKLPTYSGAQCRVCGGFDRSTPTARCIKCSPPDPRGDSGAARSRAICSGLKTYIGQPCKKCGNTEREAKSCQCVKCKSIYRGNIDSNRGGKYA